MHTETVFVSYTSDKNSLHTENTETLAFALNLKVKDDKSQESNQIKNIHEFYNVSYLSLKIRIMIKIIK